MKTLSDKIGNRKKVETEFANENGDFVTIRDVIDVKEVKQFIKEMDDWCEHIGRTTLITAETFMEVLKEKAGNKLIEEKQ